MTKKFFKCIFFGFLNSGAKTSTSILKYSVPSAKFLARFPITLSSCLKRDKEN